MATSANVFVANLAALTIAGVDRSLAYPPASVNNADLPLQFVQSPALESGHMTFQAAGGWPTLRAMLIVVTGAVSESRQEENFELAVDMLDAVVATLRSEDCDLAKTAADWNARVSAEINIAGHMYWGVVTEVTAHG